MSFRRCYFTRISKLTSMRLQIQDPTCRADVDWGIESEIEWTQQCNELMNALFNDERASARQRQYRTTWQVSDSVTQVSHGKVERIELAT